MVASSSSSSSSSAGYALAATAMALSGTLVLFSLCRAKPNPAEAPSPRLRPCLSSSEKRKREKPRRGSMKRVRFADDVVDNGVPAPARAAAPVELMRTSSMPANREALYRGMLRGRSILRVACSY
ncbi:hypothetical protein PR202_gb27847 [Eleusine coracana subsp. coracana]|uniref:Uncharacterized protein n=1 Tax=Eleusine coracana subsp. coracana TaxID=191504 RepID=A0AAV5FX66_ELECO|nr:hypothetical protein QOZ80_6AG0544440 [Eleusine coracana subsp. coracana]GJN38776.1 hypothetical protein PR202_gb27847 [Eleusine coracana subsp. coracana]